MGIRNLAAAAWRRQLAAHIVMILTAAACAIGLGDGGDSREPELNSLGPAPELTNTVWLNSEAPLRLADLRGKVVLLDFWTFDCINCQRVIPSLREWHHTYAGQGLVIIGNHFPEFNHEADLDNLQAALRRLEVPYPVAQDNDGKTWYAYSVRYWPTLFLIDKKGDVRYMHIGEGRYAEIEAAIKALLDERYP